MKSTASLADATVLTPDGDSQRLGDLWADGPAVLVYLRHYG